MIWPTGHYIKEFSRLGQHVCICVTWSGFCRTANGSWGWELMVEVVFVVTWIWGKTLSSVQSTIESHQDSSAICLVQPSQGHHIYVCILSLPPLYLSTSSGTAPSSQYQYQHQPLHLFIFSGYTSIKKGSFVLSIKNNGFNFAFISVFACKHQICLL